MNLKQLIVFGIENSSEPVIKNPVMRAALEEPRTMAQGGRIRFGDGSITQVRNKSKNVVGENLRLFNQDKLYHLRLGLDKKNYYGTKEKLENIFKKRETPGGARVRNIQPPKGLVTGKDMLETAKKKNIYVSKNRQASNFADVFGFPKTTKEGVVFYDISKLNNEKTLDKILEAQVRSGSGTDYAKKRFPPKEKYEHTKKRYLAEKEAGGVKDSGWAGKKGSGVQLGHADDFWANRRITPQSLLYTPSEINKLLGDPGMIDDKIHAVYEKQEYGKLTKKGDDLKKFLNETDATLTRLAGQSDGFKQVTLSNNKTYGGQRLSVDMFDEFKGMSQKEAVQFVNKWKDEKTWNTAEEFNNIKKAKLFEINRKNAYKAALKMSQKDKTKIMDKIKGGDFNKFLKQAGFNIDKCKSSGGRVKLQGGGGVNTCIRGVIEAEQQKALKTKNFGKFTKFGKFARTAGWFLGPIDLPLELGFALPHMLQGDKEAAKRATTLGLFGWGKDKREEIKESSPEAYKYIKHVEDTEQYVDTWFKNQDLNEEKKLLLEEQANVPEDRKELFSGTLEKQREDLENQIMDTEETMNQIQVGYEGYDSIYEAAKGKNVLKDYVKQDIIEKTDKGLEMKDYGGTGMNIALGLPWDFGMKEGIPSKTKGGKPITNLKQWIEQKGQPYYKQLEHASYELGKAGEGLFDQYFTTADVKDPRDAYTELPTKYASGLASLEKQEMLEGLKRKGKFITRGFKDELETQGIDWKEAYDTGRAEGGIMNLKKK